MPRARKVSLRPLRDRFALTGFGDSATFRGVPAGLPRAGRSLVIPPSLRGSGPGLFPFMVNHPG